MRNRERERLLLDAMALLTVLVADQQTAVNNMLDMLSGVIADVSLLDARIKMMDQRIEENR